MNYVCFLEICDILFLMDKQRVYFVIDMKSFFASVECAERGLDAMKTKLVVADESRTDKTICLAVSPALKALGVKNRCRLFEIPKDINFIIAPPRMKKYIEYAAEIYGIYLKYMDKADIHVYSIDECMIDVTDYLKLYHMRAKQFAQKLMGEIWDKLHIPILRRDWVKFISCQNCTGHHRKTCQRQNRLADGRKISPDSVGPPAAYGLLGDFARNNQSPCQIRYI